MTGERHNTDGCAYLTGGDTVFCSALDKQYIPDIFKMEQHCLGLNHIKCPFHQYCTYRSKYLSQRHPNARGPQGQGVRR